MIEYKNFTNECGIYCFTNKVNGKCYVGQGINLKKRLRSHYSAMKRHNVPNMIFYTAVDKYDIENFDLEVLEFLDPTLELEELKKLLDEKEKFYIKEKNAYVPNGYNQTLGGDAGVLGYKMTEEQKEKIKTAVQPQKEKNKRHIWIRNIYESKYYCGYTYEEASKKSGVSRNVIQAICNKRYNHPYAKGWTFADTEITLFNNCATAFRDMSKGLYNENGGKFKKGQSNSSVKKSIIETDLSGQIKREYPSIKEASYILNISPRSLSKYIKSGKIVNGSIFKQK